MDAQADLNVCCMHMPTCTLCRIPAYIIFLKEGMKRKQGLGLITNIIEPRHEISKNQYRLIPACAYAQSDKSL